MDINEQSFEQGTHYADIDIDDVDVNEDSTEVEQPAEAQQTQEQTFELTLPNGEVVNLTASEMANGYLRQQDYTRKTQELSEQRRQLAPQQPQFQQQPPQQPQPNVDYELEYTQRLAEIAKGNVEKKYGVYDPFADNAYLWQTALAKEVMNVENQAREMASKMQQEKAVTENFNNVLGKYQSMPDWEATLQYADKKLMEMPFEQGIRIKNAIDARDPKVIDEFFTAMINERNGGAKPQVKVVNKGVPYISSPQQHSVPRQQTKMPENRRDMLAYIMSNQNSF
jgi:HD-GYP domain-containing protein (c-di-GMP phosphodiesterase class II)